MRIKNISDTDHIFLTITFYIKISFHVQKFLKIRQLDVIKKTKKDIKKGRKVSRVFC